MAIATPMTDAPRPSSRAGTRRTNDPEGVRRRILDVAFVAFQSRGYHATSTHDLMREAGVTGGALHHHFPTKKALGLATLRERVAPAVDAAWLAPVREAPSVAQGVQRALKQIVAELDRAGAVQGCPLNNLALELSLADPDFRAAVDLMFAHWRGVLAEKLREERPRALKPREADDLAHAIVAAYSGAMAMAKASQSAAPLKACARQLAHWLAGPAAGRP